MSASSEATPAHTATLGYSEQGPHMVQPARNHCFLCLGCSKPLCLGVDSKQKGPKEIRLDFCQELWLLLLLGQLLGSASPTREPNEPSQKLCTSPV